jgi:hypothetical protein
MPQRRAKRRRRRADCPCLSPLGRGIEARREAPAPAHARGRPPARTGLAPEVSPPRPACSRAAERGGRPLRAAWSAGDAGVRARGAAACAFARACRSERALEGLRAARAFAHRLRACWSPRAAASSCCGCALKRGRADDATAGRALIKRLDLPLVAQACGTQMEIGEPITRRRRCIGFAAAQRSSGARESSTTPPVPTFSP